MRLSILLSTVFISLAIATPTRTSEEKPNKVLRAPQSLESSAMCRIDGKCQSRNCVAKSKSESCNPCGSASFCTINERGTWI
ncbi:hypothetical protein GMOD_00001163 [Pyrenophora seminiperda CCB06]|uniref:Uncharacterized protein n=1 Tax=Pyrenophora seminiperda CCB06 TaxID=1302712 RepID=A0A3M7LYJ8_9PLEO|nr:hypothetical protein GMOD_00001163 [Pyrenophora seminiperda CCB06]